MINKKKVLTGDEMAMIRVALGMHAREMDGYDAHGASLYRKLLDDLRNFCHMEVMEISPEAERKIQDVTDKLSTVELVERGALVEYTIPSRTPRHG